MNQSPFTPMLRRITLMALLLAGAFTAAAQTEPAFTEKYETYAHGAKVPVCTMKEKLLGTVIGGEWVGCHLDWRKIGFSASANFFTLYLTDLGGSYSLFADLEAHKMQCGLLLDNDESVVVQGSVEFRPFGNGLLRGMKGDLKMNPALLLTHNIRVIVLLPVGFDTPYLIGLDEDVETAPVLAAMSKRLDVMLRASLDELDVSMDDFDDEFIAEVEKAAAEAAAAKKVETKQPESVVVDNPTVWPSYPGGMPALMRFMAQNLQYPAQAREQGVQGRVVVEFVVETDGRLTGCRVLRSVSPELDREALRLLSIMPRWEPGSKDGQPVRVRYTYPIAFRLE